MRNFNLDDFTKWVEEQEKIDSPTELTDDGQTASSKLSFKKLVGKIFEEDGDRRSICKDFYQNGGTILETNEENLTIEVDSGTFKIAKCHVQVS